jgi:hypothetical protein
LFKSDKRKVLEMAGTKYGHLIKKLKYEPGEIGAGKEKAEYMTSPTGKDLEGINLGFAWGYRHKVGAWASDGGISHVHPYGECLVFTGLDYNKPNFLGAEIEIEMGQNRQKHVFDSPTIIVAPPGFPHCPLVSRRVDRPFGFLAISLGGEHKTTPVTGESIVPENETKNKHLVNKMELRDMHRKTGGNADYIAWWNGKDLEGFNLNFTWAFHTGLGAWHERDPHVHPNDECLLFVGLDPDNPDYLGAEIEIAMGKEQEVHVFDSPTVVVVPGGLVHCPLITRKVEKPYSFSAISLNTEHETTWLGAAKT